MTRLFLITGILIIFPILLNSQELPEDPSGKGYEILKQVVIEGDTLLHSTIQEIIIFPEPEFNRRRDLRRYRRLVHNLKVVYPYAVLAAEKLEEMNKAFMNLNTERERKTYVKQVEQELMDEFEDDLKKLTITQGRLLIKLIDRETGDTSYHLVRELRGSFSAFFWQAIARLFGSNLKTQFDAEGEDKLIDQIIHLIDNGQI